LLHENLLVAKRSQSGTISFTIGCTRILQPTTLNKNRQQTIETYFNFVKYGQSSISNASWKRAYNIKNWECMAQWNQSAWQSINWFILWQIL